MQIQCGQMSRPVTRIVGNADGKSVTLWVEDQANPSAWVTISIDRGDLERIADAMNLAIDDPARTLPFVAFDASGVEV